MTEKTLPKQAKVVIIGGGVAGSSVAYHLAKLGWTDIVLLERKQLTSGTTWHAAGLIGQSRPSPSIQKITQYSAHLYETIEAETEIATGFKRNGSILPALSEHRAEEVKRLAAAASFYGLDCEIVSPSETKAKYPMLNADDVHCGLWIGADGQADPANVTLAMAKGARQQGAQVFENIKVTAIHKKDGRVAGVATDRGDIEAEYVVNCAGMWGREVGRMAGVAVPLHACEHFYIVTEAIPDLPSNLPVLRVPDECAYYKEDAGKILLGAFEPVAKPWGMNGISDDFCFDQLPEDFDHFEPILSAAVNRLPILETAGIHTFFNGPESFTPDDQWIMGEAPELENFYTMCGFNSVGIVSSGGAGRALAEWMDAGEPPFDLSAVDIRRFHSIQNNKTYLYNRATEVLGLLYADHFPYRQFTTARGVRRSPVHDKLVARGACMGELAGWERPNWFLPKEEQEAGKTATYDYSWGRQNWFDYAAAEHKAVREHVGFFDMSSFGKLRVEGADALDVLQYISSNDVDIPVGRLIYTTWLNRKGGIEIDVTVSRLSETSFLIIAPAATLPRNKSWLERNMPEGAHCVVTDVTALEAVFCIMGPKSRDFLQALTPDSLDNDVFPFGTVREIEIGMGIVRAHRVSYVGELGWELYVSSDQASYVFDVLMERGDSFGLKLCGLHVLDSCRIEKAFRHFGYDITDEDHVLEAGLGFAVKTGKPDSRFGAFIGRDAVLARKAEGLKYRLMQFKLKDPEPLLFHHEIIYRDGDAVGYLASGNYGHWLGGAIGLGYVPVRDGESLSDMLGSTYQIDVAGTRYDAELSIKPMYDPSGDAMKS